MAWGKKKRLLFCDIFHEFFIVFVKTENKMGDVSSRFREKPPCNLNSLKM